MEEALAKSKPTMPSGDNPTETTAVAREGGVNVNRKRKMPSEDSRSKEKVSETLKAETATAVVKGSDPKHSRTHNRTEVKAELDIEAGIPTVDRIRSNVIRKRVEWSTFNAAAATMQATVQATIREIREMGQEWKEENEKLKAEKKALEKKVQAFEQAVNEKERVIAAQVKRMKETLQAKEDTIETQNGRIHSLEGDLQDKEATAAAINGQVQELKAKLVETQKDSDQSFKLRSEDISKEIQSQQEKYEAEVKRRQTWDLTELKTVKNISSALLKIDEELRAARMMEIRAIRTDVDKLGRLCPAAPEERRNGLLSK